MIVESPIASTPDIARLRKSLAGSTSSSLKRRSLIPQSRVAGSRDEEQNDDDAERSSLVASERAVATSTPASPRRLARDTMSSSPQKEHFQGCLKLYAENKITKDNAWNLQLIDFMSSMLRRHDARMENLQTASTVVDASARIYSFRVDAVHHDVLKMAGGLSKAAQAKRGKRDEDVAADDGAPEPDAGAPKKKKKRAKGAVAANPDVFNGDVDINDCIDPFFERLAATAGDVTSSNRAFNATLPVHDDTLALILRTDIPFLEPIPENESEELQLTDRITLATKLVPAFTDDDHICEPFTGFSISNWDPQNEDSATRVNAWMDEQRLNASQQALAFDPAAPVEPAPPDEPHDLLADEPLGGLDSDEEADVAVAACAARAAAAGACAPRLADMRPTAASDATLEYSYCSVAAAWAGPAHWRLKNNRASKLAEKTPSTAGGRLTVDARRPARGRRQLDFLGAGLAWDAAVAPAGDYEPTQPAKIMISRKTLATGHTWNEANFKTPVDRGLDESHFRRLFLRPSVALAAAAAAAAAGPTPVDVPHEYNYDNENDASYCATNAADGEEWTNEEGAAAGDPHEQPRDDDLGDMIEPPTKVAKIFIPYAVRAKKVDMKQLKQQTWRMLTEQTPPGEKEDVQQTTFFSVYSKLPSRLSTNMRESLSVPLALLSVLHLANERGLVLEKSDELNDFGIIGLIK